MTIAAVLREKSRLMLAGPSVGEQPEELVTDAARGPRQEPAEARRAKDFTRVNRVIPVGLEATRKAGFMAAEELVGHESRGGVAAVAQELGQGGVGGIEPAELLHQRAREASDR